MRLNRIKALRWQGRSLPDDIKNNLSVAELQVCLASIPCPMLAHMLAPMQCSQSGRHLCSSHQGVLSVTCPAVVTICSAACCMSCCCHCLISASAICVIAHNIGLSARLWLQFFRGYDKLLSRYMRHGEGIGQDLTLVGPSC